MLTNVLNLLERLPKEWITFIIAALPISELRGAIPVALSMNMPLFKAYWVAVLGNLVPVIPLLVALGPLSTRLRRFRLWHLFFEWLFERTKRRADLVEKYGAIGLIMFVAIPLPVTGAWTGCIAASLFKIRFRYALIAITLGVLIAGIIVSAVSTGGFAFYKNVTGG